jgi:hypothetical protein
MTAAHSPPGMMGTKSPIFDIEHLQLFDSRTGISRFCETPDSTQIKVSSVQNRYPVDYWLKLFPLPGQSSQL